MQFTKKTLAVAIMLGLLAGCGGSDSSSDVQSQKTLTAIDGYLSGAEVYIDRNANGKADADEKLDKLTDKNGHIAISINDEQYDVIIRAIAGQTIDSDKGGTVENSFDLVAKGSSAVVSPFTTIADAQNKTVAELAAELNYDEKVLTQDYLVLKSKMPEAKKVHLFARSVVSSLDMDKSSAEFDKRLDSIKKEIQKIENSGGDFDDQIIYLSDSGVASVSSMPPTLAEFMDNKTYVAFSMNDFWRTRNSGDEFAKYHFDFKHQKVVDQMASANDRKSYQLTFDPLNPNSFFMTWPKNGADCEYPYKSMCRSEMQDNFIYMEHDFALAVSVDGDVQIYVKPKSTEAALNYKLENFAKFNLSDSPISLNGYHHLDDTKTTSSSYPWNPTPKLTPIKAGGITIENSATGMIKFGGVDYQVLRGNGQVYLVKRSSDDHPSLLFRSQKLAELIKSKWENNKLKQPSNN